ncbi:hypothetical protein [Paragemmobacter ruber]|uniref:Uncharacterized protein n=1 Tax=Paragemmobacter ruber TaxID=1985673 RepID=A0ABW9Y0D4_9RHOB|nr:hypothetical protein [Rhodobacter ruber]NBE05948.1 hypothetical protein [Rhodobacter ruber]
MAFRVIRFSEPLFRKLWLDPKVSCEAIRARFDCSQHFLSKRARRMGLPSRAGWHVQPKIGGPEFVAMYEAGVAVADLCREFGWSHSGINDAVKRLGLAPRPHSSGVEYSLTVERYRAGIRIGGEEFRAMWVGNVRVESMAEYFGIDPQAVRRLAYRLGLPHRRKGQRVHLDVAEFKAARAQDELRAAMARSAAETAAALRARGLVNDRPGGAA